MENKVLVVTGSSGLIGKAVCQRLAHSEYTVVGLDKEGPPNPPTSVDCIFVDLESDESVQNAFHIIHSRYGRKIDGIVHLAAYYDFNQKESPKYDQLTVKGTERILRELKHFEVAHFIFASTMLVHAPAKPGDKTTEASPIEATWGYPRSKVQAEQLLNNRRGAARTTVLEIAGVYTDSCQSIPIAHQIQRIYERQFTSHFYPGDLNTRQSFVHLDDLVDAIVAVLKKRDELEAHSVFLIGEETAVPYVDLQNSISQALYGKNWTTYAIPSFIAKAGAQVMEFFSRRGFIKPWMIDRAGDTYDLDISAAKTKLVFRPKHRLKATIPSMVSELRSDPARFYEINKLDKSSLLPAPKTQKLRGAAQH